MAENNLTPTPNAKVPAERKLTFKEKLRINWPYIPAVVFVITGIRMFTLTTGTQLLFTDSDKGNAYKYYWIWLLFGVLFTVGGAIARPVMKKKFTETVSAPESAPVNTEPVTEISDQEVSAETITETVSAVTVPVDETTSV